MKNYIVLILFTPFTFTHASESTTTTTSLLATVASNSGWKAEQSTQLSHYKYEQITVSPDGQTILVADKNYKHIWFYDASTLEETYALTRSEYSHTITTENGKEFTLNFSTRTMLGGAPETLADIKDQHQLPVTFKNNKVVMLDNGTLMTLSHYSNFIQVTFSGNPNTYILNDGNDKEININTLVTLAPDNQTVFSFGNINIRVWPLSNKNIADMFEKKPTAQIDHKALALAFFNNTKFVTLSHAQREHHSHKLPDTIVTVWEKKS